MAPFSAAALPHIIGHRGAAGRAPENTLAAFRVAKELGARWVEFDVRLSRDGRCILLHDDLIDRTTDGTGMAAGMSLDELASFDAGSWFDPRFAGEAIPTLEETIDLLAELSLGANIEIKPHPGTAAETAEAVCRVLASCWPASLPAPLVSSFTPEALETAHRVAPGIARGVLTSRIKEDWRRQADAIEAATIHCDHTHLTAARAREVRAAGFPLLVYTVNHAGRAEELFSWGISAVFTDVPDEIAKVA